MFLSAIINEMKAAEAWETFGAAIFLYNTRAEQDQR